MLERDVVRRNVDEVRSTDRGGCEIAPGGIPQS